MQREVWGHVTSHPAQLSAPSLHPASQVFLPLDLPPPVSLSQAHRLPSPWLGSGASLLGGHAASLSVDTSLGYTVNWGGKGQGLVKRQHRSVETGAPVGRGARRQVSTREGCGGSLGGPRGRRTGSTHIGK